MIFDVTLGADQASFDSNTILGGNIPQTYASLKFSITGRSTSGAGAKYMTLIVNNDGGANYDWERLFAHAGGIGQDGATSAVQAVIGELTNAADSAGRPGAVAGELYDYAQTNLWKAVLWQGAMDADTTRLTQSGMGVWKSTAAVTRLKWDLQNGDFLAGTRLTLWGLRAS